MCIVNAGMTFMKKKMRLAGRRRVWWVWFRGRSSCRISHPMPYFHKSSPASCIEYRHIWPFLCAFIFLISLATNRNTCVTLYKKDAFRNIPDMVCRIAGSDVGNYTQGMMLIWFSSPNITTKIMGKTHRTHWSEVERILNISRETWRKEPLFDLGMGERKTLKQIIEKGIQMYWLFIFID